MAAERLKAAQERIVELKAAGNAEFKSRNYLRAIGLYTEAIEVLLAAEEPSAQDGAVVERMEGLSGHLLYGNRCICRMKLGRYEDGKADAQEAVSRCPSYAKGFYNLATCQLKLHDLAGAWESATKAVSLSPDDEDIRALERRIEALERGEETL